MTPSPLPPSPPPSPPSPSPDPDRTALVEAFVRRQFDWPGTLRLHGAAVGLDLLRAPVNLLLSPVLMLARIAAWVCRRLRLPRVAGWLAGRRLLLRTAVAARVEAAVLRDVLDVPLPAHPPDPGREALKQAVLAAPAFRALMRGQPGVAEARAAALRIVDAVGDYSATRSSIAEFTTGLITLAIGAVAFRALTPGVVSMAPGVAEAVSRGTAIAEFPLGQGAGALWYGVFPVGPSPGLIALTVLALMLAGSVVAAFAGVIADPVQVRLGLHRRRLLRLLATLDAETAGRRDRPFAAAEHALPRLFDLWDAALSVLRAFRG